jgi:hypothetical protein
MATTAAVTRNIEATLREVAAEVVFLPELAEGWEDEPESARASWFIEWGELFSRLSRVAHEYHAGTLSEEQRVRFESLVRDLREGVPLFERLSLPLPPASLWD